MSVRGAREERCHDHRRVRAADRGTLRPAARRPRRRAADEHRGLRRDVRPQPGGPRRLLARAGGVAAGLDGAVRDGGRRGPGRRPHRLVPGRAAERERQLPRPAPGAAGRQDGAALGGRRAGRQPPRDLRRTARAGLPHGERAARARHRQGRPGRDLHGHGARAGRGDAGLRAHRRGALGDFRRLQRAVDRGPDRRLGLRGGDHAGRGAARRPRRAAEGERGPRRSSRPTRCAS